MNDCRELSSEVMAITAIPLDNIRAADPSSVANVLAPTVPADRLSYTVDDPQHGPVPNPVFYNCTFIGRMLPQVGRQYGGALIPIVTGTGRAKGDEADGVAGRLHTVTVSCEVDPRDGEVWLRQLTLERSAHHLLVTYRNGSRAFAAATADSYQCTVERDGAKVSVRFRIQNLMGLQQLV